MDHEDSGPAKPGETIGFLSFSLSFFISFPYFALLFIKNSIFFFFFFFLLGACLACKVRVPARGVRRIRFALAWDAPLIRFSCGRGLW